MIRSQIQFEEEQLNWLRNESKNRGVSISQVVREGITLYKEIKQQRPIDRKTRALQAIGNYSSGKTDIAEKHDQYLADFFEE